MARITLLACAGQITVRVAMKMLRASAENERHGGRRMTTDPQIGNGHPERIIICSAMGAWVEFEKSGRPEVGDCPFAGCDCIPTLFVRSPPRSREPVEKAEYAKRLKYAVELLERARGVVEGVRDLDLYGP